MAEPYSKEMTEWLYENASKRSPKETIALIEEKFGRKITKDSLKNWMYRRGMVLDKSAANWKKLPERETDWLYQHWQEFDDYEDVLEALKHEFPDTTLCKKQINRWYKIYAVPLYRNKAKAASNAKPVGSERIIKGATYIKVSMESPDGNYLHCWKNKGKYMWEQYHGMPFPDGYQIRYADGDKTNLSEENLVAIPNKVGYTLKNLKLTYSDKNTLETAVAIAQVTMAAKRQSMMLALAGKSYSGTKIRTG